MTFHLQLVFARGEPPHMWNYHIPGFIRISLLYEGEYDVVDNFLWGIAELEAPFGG
ncbi:hypothetical protein LF1_57170 [Rubripirellula obstinata]|uniref:Uncharacterized protein n=1 Tax=Rubripirellula obstinata TaxID=406547 RepID=A0A5B1C9S8_9BACT|nr:hypothetical protein [Rubripirellula obstinata]KAA1256971.1 hypothetical protein LF1_57170 [Rubripirellula obstinata]